MFIELFAAYALTSWIALIVLTVFFAFVAEFYS
jgi:hypothetical protein